MAIALLSALLVLRFALVSRRIEARSDWYEGGPGAPNLYPGRNFYQAELDRYPDFGIVTHSVDVKVWSGEEERSACRDAILLCQAEFSKAFHDGEITAWDGLETNRSKWIEKGIPCVRFNPKYVVIIIRNNFDFHIFKEYEEKGVPVSRIPTADLAFPYKCGYVIKADELFSRAPRGVDELVSSGFRDASPLSFDFAATVSKHQTVYDIIDSFVNGMGRDVR